MKQFPMMSRGAVEAYDHLSLPVWVFSVETLGILSANPAARDWIGYDGQTLQDMTIADLRPEPDRAGTIDQVRRFDGTQADAGTWIIIARSGDRYTATFTWSKVLFEGAEAIVASLRDATQLARVDGRDIVTGVVRDSTAVTPTEDVLLRRARRRRFAGRLARLGSWRVDLVDMHICWDEETAAIHDEPAGTSPTPEQALAYYIPEHRDRICAQFEACIKEGCPIDDTYQIRTAKGRLVWVHALGEPIYDERRNIVAIEGAFQDITARKQADLALRANEERFRLVTKATGSAIWDWDQATDQDWWSEGFQDIFGHQPDLSGSVPTAWRRHVHPDDLARVDAACQRLLSGHDTTLREQYRFQRADGSWASVEDNAFALHDEDGRLRRVMGSMTDISEQKLLEERLRQAQKLETVGQLTGGVAHDFNNLLTIILGNAEILEDKLSDLPHLQRLARMSLDAAERGAKLNNRLLAFSRRQPLEPKTLDVAQLVQAMEALLRRAIPENIDIEIVRAGGLWKTEVDAAQLEAALLNLALNARDAMPEGGNLTIEMANAMLDDDYVALEPDVRAGQYVVIVVTDTGQGIAPDVMSRVFEPFFTTKATGKGSGLGLSMAFGFVKQSGGHIRVYSEVGEGTSIKVYFPRSPVGQDPIVTVRAERRVTGGTETVLVVEDDDPVREYVSAQLQGLGYHVLQASTGPEAMDILTRTPEIDLLFTDVVMPGGMGGRELADAARKARPDLKVLFTSGYTENAIVHDGRLDPGVVLLSKPYRREQLAAKIRDVLDDRDH